MWRTATRRMARIVKALCRWELSLIGKRISWMVQEMSHNGASFQILRPVHEIFPHQVLGE